MRSISRSAFIALVAVFAMSVVGAASVSAAICHESLHGETVGLCIEKAQITGQNVALTGEQKKATSAVILRVESWGTVTCKSTKTTGTFNTSGLSLALEKLKIEYLECEVVSDPTDCGVQPIVAQATGSFQGANTGSVKLKGALKATGNAFAEFTIYSKAGHTCVFAQENAIIKGELTCELPHSEEALEIHEMVCPLAKSSLTWAGHQDLSELTELLKLESKKLWGLMVS